FDAVRALGAFEERGEREAFGDDAEGLPVGRPGEGFEQERVEEATFAVLVKPRADVCCLALQPPPAEGGEGLDDGTGSGPGAGRPERREYLLARRTNSGQGDDAPGAVVGHRGATIVGGDHVEDHAGIGRVVRVAMAVPAPGAEVKLDIAAQLVPVE